MAKTFSDLISNRKKAREEEERNKISSSDNGKTTIEGIIEKSSLKKSIGLDTFESDLADMGNKINSIYGEWQTPETMANTRVAVESMQKRVNDYATYQKKYAPDNAFDADSLLKGYQTVLNDWDKLAETYSTFKDAESYKNYPNYLKSLEADQKKKEENVKALDNSFDQYKDYLSKEDYAEKSQYQSTAKREGISGFFGVDTYDETYEFINDENDMRNMLIAKYKEGNGATELEQHGYQYMTDEEKGVYNYKYAVEGKESADQYLKDLEISLNKRVYDESTAKWEKMSETPTGSIVLSLISPITSMAGGIGSGIETIKENVTGEKYNPYAPGRVAANATSDIRQYVGENIAESTEGMEVLGQNIPQFLYQTGMSIADSALGAATLGRAFTPIMGMNAYQQKAKEMTEAGEDESVVKGTALASGIAEALFEYVSIDKLLKIKNVDGIKNAVKSTLAQMGIEGSEELFTETANILSDVIIRGDGSDIKKQYNDLIARGFSPSEANTEVAKQIGSQVGWAFVGGALSGGVMGGVTAGNQYHNLKSIGADIRSNDRVSEMMDVAGDAFMSLSEKDAYNLYTEYANKGVNAENIKDAQLGNLYASVVQNVEDVSHSKKATPQEQNDIKRQIEGLAKVDAAKTEAEKSRETRVKALNTGEVTEVTATGNSAKIEGIRIEDGKTLLQTNEGEVSTENMTFSQNDAELLAYAEGMGEVKGSLLMAQYDGKTDVESYVNSFEMAYAYGETGFGSESVLKNKGVLSESQASAIYASAMTNKAKAQQSAIDAITQKYSANTEYHGTVDDSSINYENLTTTQRDAVNFVKSFAQVTGMNVKLFESKVVDGKRVGKNGSYNKTTNTIEIDVHAGIMDAKTLNDTIIPTMSHEVTHWMKAKAPTMYNNMREIVMNTLSVDGLTSEQRVAAEMKRMRDAHPDMEVTEDDAIDEIVARGCEDMLSNSQKARDIMSNLSETEQKSFIDKVKSTFKNLIDWVNDLLSKYKSKSHEAQILRQYKESLQKLSEAWDQALTEAIQTNKALTAEGITGEQVIGENLFTETTAQLSMRTYENEGRELLHKWLENSDLDAETKTEIIEQMDHVYNVAAKYAEDNSLMDFGSWSETDIIRGADGSPLLSVVVPNGDYPLNIDFSQVCKKRKTLNAVLNALVRSGDLDFRSLSQGDINSINRIIKEHGFEIACALCFVDSKRYRVNDWADSFTDTYNKLVKSLTKGTDFVVDEFNYTGRPVKGVEGKLLKDADDSELNFDYINEVLAKNSSGKAIYRYALAIKNNKDLRSILRSSEIISSAGLDAIKVENRTLYDLVNSHQGSAKPKLAHGEVPYAYDILLQKKFNAEDAYKVGGVRMQSFSDYMANMFFDYVQMIGDLAAKQLPAHAYTKEYYFAKLFGLTGIKINLSVVPKGADITDEQKARFNKMTKAAKEKDAEFKKLKSHAGLDANGNYILEDETFPLDKALEIQNTEGYDKNCGIIWVGVSKKHIEKMLDDPNVPYIIPYHKSSLNPLIARMRNIDFYNDYTKAQNTRYDTKAKKKVPASIWNFDFYGDLAKTNDPRTTADNYIRECRERGYLPKFDDFADHPNYYKLLIDFRVYDNKGNYAPQGAVQMKFPDNFNEIVGESLREAQETSARLDASMEGLLSEIRKELKIEKKQYSDRNLYLNDEDIEAYLKSGNRKNMKRRKAYEEGKKITISSKAELENFVSDSISKKISGSTVAYGRVSDDLADKVYEKSNGKVNIHGFFLELTSDDLFHSYKEHQTPKRVGNLPLSETDLVDALLRVNSAAVEKIEYHKDNRTDISLFLETTDEKMTMVEVVSLSTGGLKYKTGWKEENKKRNSVNTMRNNNSNANLSGLASMRDTSASNNIISQNVKNSQYSDRDSDGTQLSEEQMEYFKDSKVRDEKGNLIPLYHGTTTPGFTVFDPNVSDGGVFFLSTSRYVAGRYSNADHFPKVYDFDKGVGDVYKVYANIENPLVIDATHRLEGKYDVLIEYNDRTDMFLVKYTNEEGSFSDKITGKDFYAYLDDGFKEKDAERIKGKFPEEISSFGYKYYGSPKSGKYSLKGKSISLKKPTIYDQVEFNGKKQSVDDICKYAKANGYDGVIVHNVIDDLSFSENGVSATDVVAFNSNQIKSVANTNPTEDADIRYSDRYEDEWFDLFDSDGTFAESSAIIDEDVNRLKQRLSMGASSMSADNIKMIAKYLLQKADSRYDFEELTDDLNDIYGYIETGEYFEGNALIAKCNDVAQRILSEQKETKVTNDYAKMVMKEIRNAKIKLDAEQIAEAKNRYGEKYRNALFGRITISNDGVSLDSKWADWATSYPDIFDANISHADQITELADIYDSLREASEVKQRFDSASDVKALGAEIYNQYWIRSTISAESEKNDKKIKELNFKHREAMKKLREDYQTRLDDQKNNAAIMKNAIRSIKLQKEAEVRTAKRLGKERMDAYKDRVAKNAKIEQITQTALTLNDWMRKPTKDKHIHEEMQPVVKYLLDAIDFSSKQYLRTGVQTKKDISLQKALSDLYDMTKDMRMSADAIFALYGENFDVEMKELVNFVNNTMRIVGDNQYILNEMSLEQLETLEKIVRSIKHSVTQMNDFHVVNHKKGIINLAQEFINHAEKYGQIKMHKYGNNARFTLNWGNALPFFTMKRFGEAGIKVRDALMDGQDKLAFNADKIIKYAEKVYTSKECKGWSEDIREIEILLPAKPGQKSERKKIQMPITHIMSLYCLSKREHALGHLSGGGIKIMEFETKNGVVSQPDGILLMESELNKILAELNERHKEVANALQKFMSEDCSEWGNEISMARFGYKAFTEKNYFPIRSDEDLVGDGDPKEAEKSLYRLLNMSFAKPLTDKASNRIEIENIFDVFAQHTSEMAKYNAIALPVLDAVRWFNYHEKGEKVDGHYDSVSVKNAMRTAYGKEAVTYVRTLLKDINGADNVGRDKIAKGFMSKAKIASVGFNLKVVALQPTSYLRARAVIDGKYLIKAKTRKPKIDMAEKWCGIAKWKSFGFYDINIQRGLADLIKHDASLKDRITDASMKGAEWADKFTIGYLWNACEYEIMDKRKDLAVGTDEFNKAVGLRLRDIIYSTQVVDSTMTRSHMMRSGDTKDKILTNFASEPTLSYNMVLDCVYDWSLTKREAGSNSEGFKKYGKKFARTLYAYTVTSAITAALETAFSMFRDDDEEKDEEEIIKMYLESFALNMSIMNKIPYAKELISIAQGFRSSNMETQWMQYFTYAAKEAMKVIEGEGNAYKMTKNALQGASYLFGIPAYNFIRDAKALWNTVVGSMIPSLKIKVD